MPSRSVSITSGGVTTTKIIPDRDAQAGVRTLDVDGQTVTVNRTASVNKSDRAGESRPLLSKVVGGASAAYSLRDLNDKAGNNKVVEVRRDGDQAERTFLANEVNKIADWVNGKQETTLPADVLFDDADVKSFTLSGHPTAAYNRTYTLNPATGSFVGSGGYSFKRNFSGNVGKWAFIKNYVRGEGPEGEATFVGGVLGSYPWNTTFTAVGTGNSTFDSNQGWVMTPDRGEAAAAYSLRKVRSAYTGDAVQIRRASDNVEVNVAFDSNGEVSASSAITNVTESPDQGDTTATTFGDFLTEDVTLYQPDYSSETGLGGLNNINLYENQDGIGGKDDALKLEVVSTSNLHRAHKNINSLGGGTDSITVSYEMFVPSGSASQEKLGIALYYGPANNPAADYPSALDTWETFTHTFDGGINTRLYIQLASVGGAGANNAYFTGTTGDHVYIRNLKVTQARNGATVTTWYDQAGSNDASQPLDDRQPKIAENGSVLGDGIRFDGDSFLQKTTPDNTVSASIFGVQTKGTSSSSGARPIGYQESGVEGPNSLAFAMDNSIRFDGDAATTASGTIPTSGLFLASTIKVSNTEANNFLNGASNIADSGLTLDDTNVRFTLGFASTTPDYAYDGNIKEAIFYNSDQSANREAIESNINGRYSIY